jgi:uncharacterized membrane protein
MNTEIVVSFGPISFIAIVIQQIFIIYAIYAIFIRPRVKNSIRDKLLNIIRSRYTRGEIDTEAYRKLEKDITNLES